MVYTKHFRGSAPNPAGGWDPQTPARYLYSQPDRAAKKAIVYNTLVNRVLLSCFQGCPTAASFYSPAHYKQNEDLQHLRCTAIDLILI